MAEGLAASRRVQILRRCLRSTVDVPVKHEAEVVTHESIDNEVDHLRCVTIVYPQVARTIPVIRARNRISARACPAPAGLVSAFFGDVEREGDGGMRDHRDLEDYLRAS